MTKQFHKRGINVEVALNGRLHCLSTEMAAILIRIFRPQRVLTMSTDEIWERS